MCAVRSELLVVVSVTSVDRFPDDLLADLPLQVGTASQLSASVNHFARSSAAAASPAWRPTPPQRAALSPSAPARASPAS